MSGQVEEEVVKNWQHFIEIVDMYDMGPKPTWGYPCALRTARSSSPPDAQEAPRWAYPL